MLVHVMISLILFLISLIQFLMSPSNLVMSASQGIRDVTKIGNELKISDIELQL